MTVIPRKKGVNQPSLPWDLIPTYLAVRALGSLSGAARAMHVAQPTMRRLIAALQARLGVTLFARSATGLRPAPGTDGLPRLGVEMQALADTFSRRATGTHARHPGRVRITCSGIFATAILPAILAALRVAHPGLIINLSATNRTEDILQRAADIAIRLTPPQQDALVAQKMRTTMVGLYAVSGLVDPAIDHATFQQHGPCIGEDRDTIIASGFRAKGP